VEKTHRRVTFEYALMRGINDSAALAQELADALQGILCHVNLIPLNPIPTANSSRRATPTPTLFAQILRDAGIPATVRLRRGIEINAGCGQLRMAVVMVQ
jgi:23S rRNA (adenine2503-C2)-methyltransferase